PRSTTSRRLISTPTHPKPASRSSPAPPATWASRSSTDFHFVCPRSPARERRHRPPRASAFSSTTKNSPRESSPTFAPQGVHMAKKHSKRYHSAVKVADLTKDYPLKEAVDILAKFPKAKFDETVELSFNLGVDATSGEQNVR